jgi:hypothetical protein
MSLVRRAALVAVALVFLLTAVDAALATHARPKSATPVVFRLIPAHQGCPGFSRQHEAPFAVGGCAAAEESPYLTFNAGERPAPFNAGGATGAGLVQIRVFCTDSSTPPCGAAAGDQQDVEIKQVLVGVRCKGSSGGCSGGAGSTYNGSVMISTLLRLTDHRFDSSPPFSGPFNETGTLFDFPTTIGANCSGGTCNLTTTVETIIPGAPPAVPENARSSLELINFQMLDGGANGTLAPSPFPTSGACPPACQGDDGETIFLRNGIFAP